MTQIRVHLDKEHLEPSQGLTTTLIISEKGMILNIQGFHPTVTAHNTSLWVMERVSVLAACC